MTRSPVEMSQDPKRMFSNDGCVGSGAGSKSILRALLDPSEDQLIAWSANDLQAILLHQLAAPLSSEAEDIAAADRTDFTTIVEIIEQSGCQTFEDALQRQPPSRRLLAAFKNYAKALLRTEEGLPRDVARILYIACIQCGRRAGFRDITSLDVLSLQREVRRCLTFGWLPDDVRSLLACSEDEPR